LLKKNVDNYSIPPALHLSVVYRHFRKPHRSKEEDAIAEGAKPDGDYGWPSFLRNSMPSISQSIWDER